MEILAKVPPDHVGLAYKPATAGRGRIPRAGARAVHGARPLAHQAVFGSDDLCLAGFESPFGKIPIGLKEAVLAYPLILAAGFMVCTLLLSRLLALRREFRISLAREETLTKADVGRRVATLAPLWFDAGRAFWGNPTLILALLIPFALFVATGWLILNDWLLPLGDTASATNLRTFYTVLYGIGLAVFAAGLLRVQRAWTQDQAMPAPASPAPPA